MISKEQASVIGQAMMLEVTRSRRVAVARGLRGSQRRIGALLGASLGALIGVGASYLIAGHVTPSLVLTSQSGGLALGVLIGLSIEARTSKSARWLCLIAICMTALLAVLPFALAGYMSR